MKSDSELLEVFADLVDAVRSISHGSTEPGSQATGLEMLSMSIARADQTSLAPAIESSADRIADSIDNLADAIRSLGKFNG